MEDQEIRTELRRLWSAIEAGSMDRRNIWGAVSEVRRKARAESGGDGAQVEMATAKRLRDVPERFSIKFLFTCHRNGKAGSPARGTLIDIIDGGPGLRAAIERCGGVGYLNGAKFFDAAICHNGNYPPSPGEWIVTGLVNHKNDGTWRLSGKGLKYHDPVATGLEAVR